MFAHRFPVFIRYSYLLNALLGLVLIFSPIVWMEIGPDGIAYYGPQVPDIVAYGGVLTGKDLGFVPLLLMMLFQLFWMVVGAVLSFLCFLLWQKNRLLAPLSGMVLLILFLFPAWIDDYVRVIIGNSDGAASDLTVHWMYGWWIYIFIVVLHSATAVLQLARYIAHRAQAKLASSRA